MIRWIVLAMFVAGLSACANDEPPPPPPKAPERQKTVFDDQLKAIDRAKALKAEEEERLRKMDEQINSEGG